MTIRISANQHQGFGKSLIEILKDKWGHTVIYCNTAPKNTGCFLNNGLKKSFNQISIAKAR